MFPSIDFGLVQYMYALRYDLKVNNELVNV